MLGDAVLHAASRATSAAIEDVSRRATWTALAAAFLLSALVLGLIAAFWMTEPQLGAVRAAGVIAALCLAVGLGCLLVPWAMERIERARGQSMSPVAVTASVVEEEAKEAVDQFGALQVVGAAFLFGLGAGMRLKE